MSGEHAATFPCHPSSAAQARTWVAGRLAVLIPGRAEPTLVDDVMLIVSEFVANSVRAQCEQLIVHLTLDNGEVRIGVSDDAPGTPAARATAVTDTRGRGLAIVAAVATAWGVKPLARGKEVWACVSAQSRGDGHRADPS